MRERCKVCGNGEVQPHAGRLEQSGDTYLPTIVWACATCGFSRFEPAVGAHWRAAGALDAPEAPVRPRRAA